MDTHWDPIQLVKQPVVDLKDRGFPENFCRPDNPGFESHIPSIVWMSMDDRSECHFEVWPLDRGIHGCNISSVYPNGIGASPVEGSHFFTQIPA
jgi:hypothetical protein